MPNNVVDSVRNWLWWLFVAAIIAIFIFPIGFVLFPETYTKLSGEQEVLLFCVEVVGIAFFVVRRFVKGMSGSSE